MKFTVSTRTFLSALLTIIKVQKLQNTYKIQPIMASVKLSLVGNSLTMFTTNLDESISFAIPVIGYEDGEALVPAAELQMQVKAVSASKTKDLVTLEKIEGPEIKTSGELGKGTVNLFDSQDYPNLYGSFVDAGTLSTRQLNLIIDRVAYAAATYDLSSILGGVRIVDNGKTFEACATDGSRMAYAKEASESEGNNIAILIPVASVNMLKNIRKTLTGKIFVDKDGGQYPKVRFETNTGYFEIRQITGEYPRYSELFPSESLYSLDFPKSQTEAVLKGFTQFKKVDRLNVVKLRKNEDTIAVTASSLDVPLKAKLPLCGTVADDFAPNLNYNYVLDFFASSDSKTIKAEFSGNLRPWVFTDSDPAVKYLLMPVQAK